MKHIKITSTLAERYRQELETLLFFSPHQDRFRQGILKSIRRYGAPSIICREGLLRIVVKDYPDAQTLYAIEEGVLSHRVVGCIIYVRDRSASLKIAHVAVTPDHVMMTDKDTVPLAVQLFTAVMKAAHQIKGIKTVTVIYGKAHRLRMPV